MLSSQMKDLNEQIRIRYKRYGNRELKLDDSSYHEK